ncbi:MAG: GAF domain-containing protein [Candidatus Hydrogenedentota bacterium]
MGQHSDRESYAEALRQMTLRYERVVQALSIMRQMDELDNPALRISEVACGVLEAVAVGLAAENCSLMLVDDSGDYLELRAACSPMDEAGKVFDPREWKGRRFKMGEGVVGKVAAEGRPMLVPDVMQEKSFLKVAESNVEVRSLLCFPLRVENRVVGVLNLSHSRPGFFTVEAERTLEFIAERIARLLTGEHLRQRVQIAESRYHFVAEHASDGVVLFNPYRRVLYVNSAVEQLTGVTPNTFVEGETPWESIIHPEDHAAYDRAWQTLLERTQEVAVEYRSFGPDGALRRLSQVNGPLCDVGGQVEGVIAVVRPLPDAVYPE